jgi:DNA-binding beta-propeller fold protein YncE
MSDEPTTEAKTDQTAADGLPATAVDELPGPPEGADGVPGEAPKRSRRKLIVALFLLGLLAMLATIAVWYLVFRQPIPLPIPVIPASEVPTYATAIYGAQRPSGIAVSPSGDRIYVTQTEGDRSGVVFDGGGNKVATMAPPEATGTDHSPVYLAIDPLTKEVYVSDRLTGAIYIYDRDGAYQRTFTLAEPRPGWQPLGLAFDTSGNLYVTDLSGPAQKVLVIDRTAAVVRTLGEASKLSFPNGVAVDGAGNVYVSDSNNGRLLMFGTDGQIRAQVGRGAGTGNLGLPRGLAVDGQGRVFVADTTGQGVFIYRAPDGDSRRLDFLGFVGGEGVADAQFEYPNSVAVDARGRLYVADTFNNRVQIWSY